MWIFTKLGFFSVVEDENDHNKVFVRARDRADLAALKLDRIIITPEADYRFRVHITKNRWARKMHELAKHIDYPNFKAAVPQRSELYSEVWLTMRSLQTGVRRERNHQATSPREGFRFYQR
jgi:hypothetical protein